MFLTVSNFLNFIKSVSLITLIYIYIISRSLFSLQKAMRKELYSFCQSSV